MSQVGIIGYIRESRRSFIPRNDMNEKQSSIYKQKPIIHSECDDNKRKHAPAKKWYKTKVALANFPKKPRSKDWMEAVPTLYQIQDIFKRTRGTLTKAPVERESVSYRGSHCHAIPVMSFCRPFPIVFVIVKGFPVRDARDRPFPARGGFSIKRRW